jgi:hypothetical protein
MPAGQWGLTMTLAAIEAKGKELRKKEEALANVVAIAKKLHAALDKMQKSEAQLQKAIDDLFDQKFKLRPLVESLDTQNIKELQQIKDNMLAICSHQAVRERLLPLTPAVKLLETARKAHDAELYEWLAKQKAALPKVFKKGMVFNDRTNNRVYEMLADEIDVDEKDLKKGQRYGMTLLKTRYKDNKMLSEGVRFEEELDKLDFTRRRLEYVKL